MVRKGYYRHYKGHLYTVLGVGCAKHENRRRLVVYTSVKTEESGEGFDFLLRDEKEFEELVDQATGKESAGPLAIPRFERVIDPECSIVPRRRP